LQAIFAVHERRSIIERVKKGFQNAEIEVMLGQDRPGDIRLLVSATSQILLLWGGAVWIIDQAIISICTLSPDGSACLSQTTKAQFAREIFEMVLDTRRPAKVLNYLRQTYNVQRNSELVPPQLQSFPISDQGFRSG
jgi:hypothetical protein